MKDFNIGRFHFGYNATEDKGRRQAPKTRRQAEKRTLTPSKRNKLLATAQDQNRNHALVAWMVKKHLDYVSDFRMSFRTGNEDLDTIVGKIFKWHGAPRNFDYFGKYGRNEMFRYFELEKVIGGDAGIIKLKDLKMQALESDLIAKGQIGKGKDANANNNVDEEGLVLDAMGRIKQYSVCDRGPAGNSIVFNHLEKRNNVIFGAYWNRYSSQNRGVSPLSTAINSVQDTAEALEFNLLKAKMQALFGIAITRKSDEGAFGGAGGATAETLDAEETASGSTYDLNFRAANILDLNADEDVKMIESATPSSEFIEGCYLYIQIAMLALDIPVTCFDSRRSSFSARIADLNEYEVACRDKRRNNRYSRQEYSDWLLSNVWNRNTWKLSETAEKYNLSLFDIQNLIDWIPSGSPWLDKFKQLKGDQLAVEMLMDNPIDATKRRGGDVFENIDKIAKVKQYADKMGVPYDFGSRARRTIEEIVQDEIQEEKESETNDENTTTD